MMGVDGGYGSRSQFETEVRWANPTKTASSTPLQAATASSRRRACITSATTAAFPISTRGSIAS